MFNHLLLFFQTANIGTEEPVKESESLFSIIASSGTMGIIIVAILLVLAVIATVIFFERYATIKQAGRIDENFINNIRANVSSGNSIISTELRFLQMLNIFQNYPINLT